MWNKYYLTVSFAIRHSVAGKWLHRR